MITPIQPGQFRILDGAFIVVRCGSFTLSSKAIKAGAAAFGLSIGDLIYIVGSLKAQLAARVGLGESDVLVLAPAVQWPTLAVHPGCGSPDSERWFDGATGWPCCVVRGSGATWYGYVRLPETIGAQVLDRATLRVTPEFCRSNSGEDAFWAGFSCLQADEAKQRASWLASDIYTEMRRRQMVNREVLNG